MPVPVSQMWTVATYVLKQKLKGRKQYPLVLMLRALVSLQFSMRWLWQNPVSGPHFEAEPLTRGVLSCSR